jgi:hypothetical protein
MFLWPNFAVPDALKNLALSRAPIRGSRFALYVLVVSRSSDVSADRPYVAIRRPQELALNLIAQSDHAV